MWWVYRLTLYWLQSASDSLTNRLSVSVDWHWSFWTCTTQRETDRNKSTNPTTYVDNNDIFTVGYLRRIQSRCCCRGTDIQRRRLRVSWGSRRRTRWWCTRLCLRLCDPPWEPRRTWGKAPQTVWYTSGNGLYTRLCIWHWAECCSSG